MLDANVVVSAAINSSGAPAEVIRAWSAAAFDWVSSPVLLAEVEGVMGRPRLKRYIAWDEEGIDRFLERVRETCFIVAPTQEIAAITHDPSDNRVLEAAIAGEADYIVSGDQDLTDLGSFDGIPIVTPAHFLAILRAGML